MTESTITTYSTTDYDSIKIHPHQRKTNPSHVKKLVKAISDNNLLYQNPGTVDSDGFLVDGQHRLAAAKELGVKFWYVVSNTASVSGAKGANRLILKWKPVDEIFSYAKVGKESYQWLLALIESEKWITYTSAITMVKGSRSDSALKSIFDGDMVIDEAARERVGVTLARIDELSKIAPTTGAVLSTRFVSVFSKLSKRDDYDHNRMIAKLEYQSRKLVKCSSRTEVTKMLQEIYNFHSVKKNRAEWV